MNDFMRGSIFAICACVITGAVPAYADKERKDLAHPDLAELERACIGTLADLSQAGVFSAPKEEPLMGAAAFACGCLVSSAEADPDLAVAAHEAIHILQEGAHNRTPPSAELQSQLTSLGLLEKNEQEAMSIPSAVASGGQCPEIAASGGKAIAD